MLDTKNQEITKKVFILDRRPIQSDKASCGVKSLLASVTTNSATATNCVSLYDLRSTVSTE